jgi:hypothetical protein
VPNEGRNEITVERFNLREPWQFLRAARPESRASSAAAAFSELLHGRRVDPVISRFWNRRIRERVLSTAEPLCVAA